jgi:hypothetical protein
LGESEHFVFGDVKIGAHMFRALCQNSECRTADGARTALGALHIPCAAGRVVFVCRICGTVNEFRNGPDGFDAKVLGQIRLESSRRLRQA